jgi:APA family basic amino acid/polyamine antiporter
LAPKKLSALDAVLLVMGGIVGVGIFFNPRAIAELVPDPTWFLGVWLVGGLVALFGALTFAELGGSFPEDGGWYVFLREAFGPFPAFLFASVVLFVVSTGAIAVMAAICVANLSGLIPAIGPAGSTSAMLAGALIIVAVTAIALLGIKASATFQNACMLVKLAAIAAIVVGAWCCFSAPASAPDPLVTARPAGLAAGAVRALLPVLFACGGWQMLCYVAPQVRDPAKNLPRAILFGVLGVVAVYLAVNAAYVHVLGIAGIAANPQFASETARLVFGDTGASVLRAAMAVSALGVCVVTVIVTPWLYVAMAKEGLFFSRFARTSPTTGVPTAALLAQMVIALAYWLWGRAEVVVDAVVFVEWIFHALVAIALLRLRRNRPELPRPFRSVLYPLAPVGYLVIATIVVFGNLWNAEVRTVGIGLGVVTAAALVYRPWRRLVEKAERKVT